MARSAESAGAVGFLAYALTAALLALLVSRPTVAANWPVFDHDPARSGVDVGDTILTTSNVKRLHSRWQLSFGPGAVADSAPILLDSVPFRGKTRTMLFETAKNGTTFGIDANSGHIVWRFVTHGPNITTAMPAADPSGTAIYVPGVDAMLHKLEAATGHEMAAPGFPARVTLIPKTQKDASALNVANGYLYATTSGYIGDAPYYDGHVVSVRLSDGTKSVFNSLCSDIRHLLTQKSCTYSDSGIWSRGGAVVDPDSAMNGEVYVSTGNGDFNANHNGGENYGDSVIGLTGDALNFISNYTPSDFMYLQTHDLDLGSTSPAVLPRRPLSSTPLMLVQGGKDQILRLLNRNPLPGVAGELQEITLPNPLFATPAVWTDSKGFVWIFMGFPQEVDAYRLSVKNGVSRLKGIWRAMPAQTGSEGTSPVVSNGIVFVAFDRALVALDARTGSELWTSSMPSAGKNIGPVHWESPIVVNGWVYCSDESGHLTAYALPAGLRQFNRF